MFLEIIFYITFLLGKGLISQQNKYDNRLRSMGFNSFIVNYIFHFSNRDIIIFREI